MNLPILPPSASTFSDSVDDITLCLLAFCGLIAGGVFGTIFAFGYRYRQGSSANRVIRSRSQSWLEWSWTAATFLVFIVLFCWAAMVFFRMHAPPANAQEISVVGKQWMWKFQHADGRQELGEVHVPQGQPILLTMTSQDVIHSFFVPAFRIKQDVLPGRYEHVWFEATLAGEYDIFCTQYCGTAHAAMRGHVIVLRPEDYQRWLQSGVIAGSAQNNGTKISRGQKLFSQLGCAQCHSPNSTVPCPNLVGLFGKSTVLTDGRSVVADENYLRESIVNPGAKIVAGYANTMPSFARQASEEDLLELIAYLKTLAQSTAKRGGR